jgi:hypothetical protein
MNNFLIANLLHFCRNHERLWEIWHWQYKFVTFLSLLFPPSNMKISLEYLNKNNFHLHEPHKQPKSLSFIRPIQASWYQTEQLLHIRILIISQVSHQGQFTNFPYLIFCQNNNSRIKPTTVLIRPTPLPGLIKTSSH